MNPSHDPPTEGGAPAADGHLSATQHDANGSHGWSYGNATLAVVAPALLLIIAAGQIFVAHHSLLSPWKGGGFGMFSTIDRPHARFLRVFLVVDGNELPVEVPDSLYFDAEKLRTMPSQARTSALARRLSEQDWADTHYPWQQRAQRVASYETDEFIGYQVFKGEQSVEPRSPQRPPGIPLDIGHMIDPPDAARIRIDAVRLEVWRIRYDTPKRHLHREKLQEAIHQLEDETS
jgi:hypothetical protein